MSKKKPKPEATKEPPKPRQRDLTYHGVPFQAPVLVVSSEPTFKLPVGCNRRPLADVDRRDDVVRLAFNLGTTERPSKVWFKYDVIQALNDATLDDAIRDFKPAAPPVLHYDVPPNVYPAQVFSGIALAISAQARAKAEAEAETLNPVQPVIVIDMTWLKVMPLYAPNASSTLAA